MEKRIKVKGKDMNLEEFKKVFIEETKRNNITVENDDIELFYKYMINILEWNSKVNLTSIINEKEFIVKHFVDSLTINKYIKKGDKIIDIGTGAGFPGVPLKICNKENHITLIDSVNKKLNVIKNISENLMLENLDIIHTRAEDLANKKEYRGSFDVATTRAVSNLTTITEYMLPFLKIGGTAICMKGPNFEIELEESKNAISILGGEVENIETLRINEEFERNVIIIKKVRNTPNKYPRGQGKALKEPLK